MKGVGHGMQQKTADELVVGERHNLWSDVVAIVFPAEANEAIAVLDPAAVGDRDAMSVAAQIFLHRRRSVKGQLGLARPAATTKDGIDPVHARLTSRRWPLQPLRR